MINTSEDFYTEARRIIALAIREAQQLKQDYLGAEHILLALTVDKDSAIANTLSSVGLTPGKLRAAVEFIIGRGDHEPEKVSLSPRAKRVIEIALEEARKHNSSYCGAEHLLLAILLEENNMAFGILDGLVGEKLLDQVRDTIMGKVKGDSE